MRYKKVVFIGAGLIGGSMALLMKKKRYPASVWGLFRNQKRARQALKKGVVDKAVVSLEDAVCDAQLIVLGLPVKLNAKYVRELKDLVKPGQVVIDVGSTKSEIVHAAAALKGRCDFVACHPLAGSEKRGFEHADAGLFEASCCVVCSDSPCSPQTLKRITSLWKKMGCKVVTMRSSEHDKALAYTSHMPHALSYLLAYVLPEKFFSLSGGGLRSMLRIAQSHYPLWEEIFISNKKEVISALRAFIKDADKLTRALKKDDVKTLRAVLKKASNKSCSYQAGRSKR